MGIQKLIFYLAAFGLLSIGSNLIVTTISSFTRRIKVPPFIFSFFIVGILTSVGEIAVGINALRVDRPEIFVGSLLGGTLVIFLVVIPLMTILTGGMHVKKHLSDKKMLAVLAIIGAPAFCALDRTVTNLEAAILIILYACLFLLIRAPADTLKNVEKVFEKESKTLRENSILRLVLGTGLVFMSSRFIVEQTLAYSSYYHVSTFLVSLVVIAIGTNLPEIALAVHAASSRQAKAEDIAVGDFLGSAAANVLLFGVFTLINNGDVLTTKSFTTTFLCVLLALVSFYAFTRGKSMMTMKEGVILAGVYVLFVITQFAAA